MARTRLIRVDVTSIAMIHTTKAPGERSPRVESAGLEAEGEGVVVEVGDGEIVRVVFRMSLV